MFCCHMWLSCKVALALQFKLYYIQADHVSFIVSKNHSATQSLLGTQEYQSEYLALQIRLIGSHNLI